MAQVELKEQNCKEGPLTLGQLRLHRKTDGLGGAYFPDATHILFVDLLPTTPGSVTEFVNPTVTAEIKDEQNDDVFTRSFVPWKTNTAGTNADINKHWPDVLTSTGWEPHLLPDNASYPKPTLLVRLRRADGSMEYRGSATQPNGVTFRFGLKLMKGQSIIDDVVVLLNGSFEQVVVRGETCVWEAQLSEDGDKLNGFFG